MQRREETRTKKPQSPPWVTIETPNKPTASENIVVIANRIHYIQAVTSVYAQPIEKSRLERYVRLSKWDERVLRYIDWVQTLASWYPLKNHNQASSKPLRESSVYQA